MEILLALTGSDYTLLATSRAAMRGATILKSSDDKTRNLNPHNILAFSGEPGDTINFAEYVQANIALYSMRNQQLEMITGADEESTGTGELGTAAIASFIRSELAKSLRSRKPYNVNCLLAGVDARTGEASLYWLDYLASAARVPYAAHGYAQYYCLSILDKHHHPSISFEQGMKILRMCTDELQRRLPIDFKGMNVKVVRKTGIEEVPFDMSKPVAAP